MRQIDKNILFVDTETSGIPADKMLSYRNIDNWPTIKQIAWIIYKKDGTLLAQRNYAIADEGEHKDIVSPTYVSKKVLPIHEIVMLFYFGALKTCDVIVGHNIEYDVRVILSELHRYGYDTELLNSIHQFCTMKNSIDVCGFDTRHGNRYPKLQELYSKLFHKPFENEHDAYCDIKATADCFWKLFSSGMLKKEVFPYLLTSQEKEDTADRFLNDGIERFEKYVTNKTSESNEILCEALSCFENALRITSRLEDEVGRNCCHYARTVLCGDINTESFFIKNKCASEYQLVQKALFNELVNNYKLFKSSLDKISPSQIVIFPSWEEPSKYQKYKLGAIYSILSIVKCCFDGTGTPKSLVEAKKWLDLGFDLHPERIFSRTIYDLKYYLGLYYEENQRYEDALSCYKEAKYIPIVLKKIGIMYLYGQGCSKSKRTARIYLEEAQLKGVDVSPYLEESKSWW